MEIKWNWLKGGMVLGAVFLIAVIMVKPIGVSTQFVIFDGIVWNLFSEDVITEDSESKTGYASENPYLNKSGGKYAKNIENPINYGFLFVFLVHHSLELNISSCAEIFISMAHVNKYSTLSFCLFNIFFNSRNRFFNIMVIGMFISWFS